MLIWMEHEKHGRMPCYNGLELENAKKNGWFECGDPPWDKQTAPTEVRAEKNTKRITIPKRSTDGDSLV